MATTLERQASRPDGKRRTDGVTLRRFAAFAAAVLAAILLPLPAHAEQDEPSHEVTVTETDGVYAVVARFDVPQPASVVYAVLTDYEHIPRYMPDVRKSRVVERGDARALIEQQAVAKVMFFQKRVHLLLDVHEDTDAVRFIERSGKSFERYEGAWRIIETPQGASVVYELTARPAFDVPAFLLSRLLRRDSRTMIERLRAEVAARAAALQRAAAR